MNKDDFLYMLTQCIREENIKLFVNCGLDKVNIIIKNDDEEIILNY